MSINGLLVQSPKPLGVSSQSNSPLHTPKSSPRKQHIQLHPSPSKMSSSLANLQSDYTNLERSYADLLLHSKSLNREKVQLENEISIKDELLSEQSEKINKFENLLKTMRDEYEKNQELYEKELFYYKELVSDLEIKINKLSNELHKIEEKIKKNPTQMKLLKFLRNINNY